MTRERLKKLFIKNVVPTQENFHELIDSIFDNDLVGPKGEDGKDGYTPVKGVDYFDGKDGKDGVDGVDGVNGKDGIDGKDFDASLITPKHWACAVASETQAVTTMDKVILGEVRGDVVFNDDRTIFTLKGGKTYRLTFYAAGTFNNATGSATFSFFNNDIGSNVGLTRSTLLPVSNATNQVHTGVLDFIFPITNTQTNLSINCGVTTGSTLTLKNLQTYLIIQEL